MTDRPGPDTAPTCYTCPWLRDDFGYGATNYRKRCGFVLPAQFPGVRQDGRHPYIDSPETNGCSLHPRALAWAFQVDATPGIPAIPPEPRRPRPPPPPAPPERRRAIRAPGTPIAARVVPDRLPLPSHVPPWELREAGTGGANPDAWRWHDQRWWFVYMVNGRARLYPYRWDGADYQPDGPSRSAPAQ